MGQQRLPLIGVAALLLGAVMGCKDGQRDASGSAEGEALFASACARCHGAEGRGGLPLWDGGPSPPSFRDHAFQAARSDEQIRRTIVEGKSTGMPPFARTFSDMQLARIIGHVRSLDPEARK